MSTYLWQNFLNNTEIISFIADNIRSNADLSIENIEIWPWKWAITSYLSFIDNLRLFEKDETFKDVLSNFVDDRDIIIWDFLKTDLNLHIKWDFYNAFGNLPYYITSPIFRKLCDNVSWKNMKYGIFMIQKEVWDKIQSKANKKSMLWFLLNRNYDIKYLRTVPADCFTPAPKVESAVVSFSYHWKNKDINFASFSKLIWILSSYKRKSLSKIQKIIQKQWITLSIQEHVLNKRAHELERADIRYILNNSTL